MPAARGGKPKKEDALLKELREIKFLLRNLLEEEKDSPPSKWKRVFSQLGLGVVRGLGVVIGATIVAGALFFILRAALAQFHLENWFADQIENAVSQQIEGHL